jgi:hypothetical protein
MIADRKIPVTLLPWPTREAEAAVLSTMKVIIVQLSSGLNQGAEKSKVSR